MSIVKKNNFDLNEYILNIEEYYGYFSAIKPFLCFYCNKTKSRKYGLLLHLKNAHGNDNRQNGNCVDHIAYIMLSKLFNTMNNRCLSRWNADDVLTKYINRLRTLSLHFKMDRSMTNNDKLEQIEGIIAKTKQIILSKHNTDDDDSKAEEVTENEYVTSSSFKEKIECDESFDEDQKEQFDALSFETKRAMMTAHFFSQILHSYFKKHHFCAERDESYIPILEHVYITGGSVRNYFVGQKVNDLDMTVDVCTLQRMQSKHLHYFHELDKNKNIFATNLDPNSEEMNEYNKYITQTQQSWDQIPVISTDRDYHYLKNEQFDEYNEWLQQKRSNCKCLWHLQYYQKILQKYHKKQKQVFEQDPVECEFIFNAKVLARIIVNELKKYFGSNQYALSVFIDKNKIIKILIKDHLVINGIDIYGQSVDIGDTSNHSFCSKSGYKKRSLQEYFQKNPNQCKFNNHFFYYCNDEMRWVQLLKKNSLKDFKYHYCELRDDVINRDFTINSLLLPLSKVLTKRQCVQWNLSDVVDFVGGVKDIKMRRFAVAPQSSVEHIFNTSPIRIMRALKYNFEYDGFVIDKEVEQGMIDYAHLLKEVSSTHTQQLFVSMVKECANDIDKTKRLLKVCDDYKLTKIIAGIIISDMSFLRHFLNVTSKFDPKIQSVYEQYEYPTLFNVNDWDLSRTLKQRKKEIIERNSSYRHLIQVIMIIDSLLKRFDTASK